MVIPVSLTCLSKDSRRSDPVGRRNRKYSPGFSFLLSMAPPFGVMGLHFLLAGQIIHGGVHAWFSPTNKGCLLYTSDAADDLLCVDLGGRRIIKKKKKKQKKI